MQNYSYELKRQLEWIDELIIKTDKSLKANRISCDNLLIKQCKRKNGYQYYLQDEHGKREYVKARDIGLVRSIAQKNYDEAVKKKLLVMRKRLDKFIKFYDIDSISEVYSGMSDARKALVTPVIPSNNELIKEWERMHLGGQNTFPQKGQYVTNKGEVVRSKSEKILADLFGKYNVPYIYEPAFRLNSGNLIYPDFVLLNLRENKTIYWEHLGMLSDGDYARRAFEKLYLYEKNGLVIGENILFSMESEKMALDVKKIEKTIKKYLI